jgi:hypothetical protein
VRLVAAQAGDEDGQAGARATVTMLDVAQNVGQGYGELSGSGGFEEWLPVTQDTSLVGSIGVVIIATRGQAGPGEVLVKIRGGSEVYIAWSLTPIPRGATVLVIESRGHRAVDVSEWTDPLDPFPGDWRAK